jgi:hypothetical protein
VGGFVAEFGTTPPRFYRLGDVDSVFCRQLEQFKNNKIYSFQFRMFLNFVNLIRGPGSPSNIASSKHAKPPHSDDLRLPERHAVR